MSLVSQQARETETWMPMSTTQAVTVSTDDNVESSGDSSNDFGFTNDDEDYYEDDLSGSGDTGRF